MRDFFKENWPWIVTPIVLGVLALVVLLVCLGDDDTSQFVYSIF